MEFLTPGFSAISNKQAHSGIDLDTTSGQTILWRRQKLSATPDQSGTVNLCHIMNSALKNA
ncbi:hypothetical protein, partial [Pseudomonas avellanae]|uniref:hypothetical protein n=1 Tax=Pseudomonas avellanae TaxID=46257 RepID=UPI001F29A1F0